MDNSELAPSSAERDIVGSPHTVTDMGGENRLQARGVTVGYSDRQVVEDLHVSIPDGSFTVIIGPNACGKSTLLRALARMMKSSAGPVLLDGQDIYKQSAKAVAKRLGLLGQNPTAPAGITVADLVGRGRHPHQSVFRQWSREDESAVAEAMDSTGVSDLAERGIDELSGGQRQRVWIAMAFAQETPLLLLDEPTTFLDITHQYEVLNLCARLHHSGRTLVAVLHDVNQAARYATHVIAMREGSIVAAGPPREVVTESLVNRVFDLPCRIIDDPETATPLVIPSAAL